MGCQNVRRPETQAQLCAGDCRQPELLFFDEPTVGLDTSARRLFWQTVRKLADQGKTILFTTHYLQEADDMADRILLFHQGQVAADGTPEAIKAKLTRRSVSFIVDADHQQVKELLQEVPGVTDVYEHNGRLNAVTDDTDTVLAALFRAGWLYATFASIKEAWTKHSTN